MVGYASLILLLLLSRCWWGGLRIESFTLKIKTYYDHLRSTTLVIYYITTWILLIVEISTPKPKSINFAKFKRKRTPERLFPLQNAFCNSRTLPNGFKRFFNAFWTPFERFWTLFSTPERPKCQERQKPLWCSFFHTNPQNRSFLGLELKNPVFGSSRYINTIPPLNHCSFFLTRKQRGERTYLGTWGHPSASFCAQSSWNYAKADARRGPKPSILGEDVQFGSSVKEY